MDVVEVEDKQAPSSNEALALVIRQGLNSFKFEKTDGIRLDAST